MQKKLIIILTLVLTVFLIPVYIFTGKLKKSTDAFQSFLPLKNISLDTDICARFSKDWVAGQINRPVITVKSFDLPSTHSCSYYTTDSDFVILTYGTDTPEGQKSNHEGLKQTIKTDSRISLPHFIAWQPNGLINSIVLILDPHHYLSADRSSGSVINNDSLINFASAVSRKLLSQS